MKPTRTLISWGLVTAAGGGPYLAGLETLKTTRASTRLVELDVAAGTAMTRNGRPYFLHGEPNGAYALEVFCSLWDTTGQEVRALTPDEAAEMIAKHKAEEGA